MLLRSIRPGRASLLNLLDHLGNQLRKPRDQRAVQIRKKHSASNPKSSSIRLITWAHEWSAQVVLDRMAVDETKAQNGPVFPGGGEGNLHNPPLGTCGGEENRDNPTSRIRRTFVRIAPPTFSCRAALANVISLMVQPPYRRQ